MSCVKTGYSSAALPRKINLAACIHSLILLVVFQKSWESRSVDWPAMRELLWTAGWLLSSPQLIGLVTSSLRLLLRSAYQSLSRFDPQPGNLLWARPPQEEPRCSLGWTGGSSGESLRFDSYVIVIVHFTSSLEQLIRVRSICWTPPPAPFCNTNTFKGGINCFSHWW